MDRRRFLKTMAAAGIALSGFASSPELFLPFAAAAEIPEFSFAHITDLHLDVRGDSTWQYREKSVSLFMDTVRQIIRLQQFKFIVFGGDQIQNGPHDVDSLGAFRFWANQIAVPYYVLLGNTEVSPVHGASRLSKAAFLNIWNGHGLAPGRTSWFFDPVRGVRIIGFDVTVDGMPHGEAGPKRLAWLEGVLDASRKQRLVIVITHQLLLPTAPLDRSPEGELWMVRDYLAVRDLLDRYHNVRMVISGHHHASHVETVNNITYVADPAVVTYPCAFRVFTVGRKGVHLRNIGLDDRTSVERARELLVADPYARLYNPDDPGSVVNYSVGLTEQDRETTIPL